MSNAIARTTVVTGATSGIGFATAAELARRGERVLVHGRSQASAETATKQILTSVPSARLRPVWGDLASMTEVRDLGAQVLEEPRLDAVIHNAGLERWDRHVTSDGFELTLAVNHLAPFLLTWLLTPLLERSRPARVVFVSSMVHGWGEIHWDDLQAEHWYKPEPVYYQSKLAAALTAQEFARRLAPKGVDVMLVPPGIVHTGFGRDFRGFPGWWARVVGARLFRRPEAVARELASVATDDAFANCSGAYVDRLEVGLPAVKARVRADQARLWRQSCELLGLAVDELPRGAELPELALSRPTPAVWLRAVTLGELLGFTSTALVAFIGLSVGGHPNTVVARIVALIVMTMAGVLEGAALGFFQWRALRRWLPDLSPRRFVGATIAVAAGGWFLGMSVPLLGTIFADTSAHAGGATGGPGPAAVAMFAVGFGAVAGALFGIAQGVALKPHVRGVGVWIAGNAAGWATGLPLAYLAGSVGTLTMSWWQALGLSAAAGIGMGLCVACGTLVAMRRLEKRHGQ